MICSTLVNTHTGNCWPAILLDQPAKLTAKSSGDEIANVNFLYDDIVVGLHALQNTMDSCTNSATDRRGYVSQHRFNKFSEITQCNGHYAVQGHSRSSILVPIESSYTTSYWWLILTYLLSYTVSTLWLIIGQIFASESRAPHFNALAGGDPLTISTTDIQPKTRYFDLHFRRRKCWCIFNHFYVIYPESYRIRWNYAAVMAITSFKVIQAHRVLYQSKAHMRLPISD